MDPLIAKVLSRLDRPLQGAVQRAKVNLKATAQQGKSVATGTVSRGRHQ